MSFWTQNRNRADLEHRLPKRVLGMLDEIRPVRQELVTHAVYRNIRTIEDLHTFMEHHVFAVWDFMCVLKTLQYHLTSVRMPWVPKGDPNIRRLLNHIVLSEETDEASDGSFKSHFELYLGSMRQVGADTSKIDDFIERMWRKEEVPLALESCGAPLAARKFVNKTFEVVDRNNVHEVAAAFTFSREDVVPEMFQSIVDDLRQRYIVDFDRFVYYLDRHIALDGDEHGPMAFEMISEICGEDAAKWNDVKATAVNTIRGRIELWNGVLEQINRDREIELKDNLCQRV